MVIDMASVFAERYKNNPQILQAAVLGQSPVPGIDPFTALRGLQLLKESQQSQMGQQAQQPTQAPSLVQQAIGQPVPQMGMGGPQPQQPQQPPQAGLGALAAAPQQPQPGPSQGLAGLPAGQQNFAPGGIVAFAGGKLVRGDEEATDGGSDDSNYFPSADPGVLATLPGGTRGLSESELALFKRGAQATPEAAASGPAARKEAVADLREQWLNKALERLNAPAPIQTASKAYTPEEAAAGEAAIFKRLQAEAGPDHLAEYLKKYQYSPEQKEEDLRQGRGLGLLRAAAAMARPGRGFFHALSEAGATFGESYASAQQAQQQREQALDRMRVQLLDAQRKERIGLLKQAKDTFAEARKSAADADRAEQQRKHDENKLYGDLAIALLKDPKEASQSLGIALMQAEQKYALSPTPENKAAVDAARTAAAQMQQKNVSTSVLSDIGANRQAEAALERQRRIDAEVSRQLEHFKQGIGTTEARNYDKAMRAASNTKLSEAERDAAYKRAEEMLRAQEEKIRRTFETKPSTSKPPAAKPGANTTEPIKLD